MVKDQNMRTYGTLHAAQVNIKAGDAMYWDAAGTLRICGVNDHYRYAGQALIIGSNATGLEQGGHIIALDTWGVRHAYGDPITFTYVKGQWLTTGATGFLIPYLGRATYQHTVTGGEAAAGIITLPAYCDAALAVYNANLFIDFVISTSTTVPGLGVVGMNVLADVALTFNLVEINAGDIIDVTYLPKNGKIAKLMSALDGNDRCNVQLGGV